MAKHLITYYHPVCKNNNVLIIIIARISEKCIIKYNIITLLKFNWKICFILNILSLLDNCNLHLIYFEKIKNIDLFVCKM